MAEINPNDALRQLIEAHDCPCTEHEGWLQPARARYPVRAEWYPAPGGLHGCLCVEAAVEDGRSMLEQFAGIGEGDDGLANGFENFCQNSLHVMLAALWGGGASEYVAQETWQIGGRAYTAFIGGVGMRGQAPATLTLNTLFAALEAAIKATPLALKTHWVRTFFCNFKGEPTFEALLDNEDWPQGLAALHAQNWPSVEAYYSARNFIILQARSA